MSLSESAISIRHDPDTKYRYTLCTYFLLLHVHVGAHHTRLSVVHNIQSRGTELVCTVRLQEGPCRAQIQNMYSDIQWLPALRRGYTLYGITIPVMPLEVEHKIDDHEEVATSAECNPAASSRQIC